MAAALQCEICGGKLVGKPGGIFECDSCGMEYSTEWAKQKIQEIRGTVKVEGTVEVTGKVQVEGGTVNIEGTATKESLLKRAKMCYADGDWEKAEELLEQVLNADPECGEAYLYRAAINKECKTLEALRERYEDIYQDSVFSDSDVKKAFQFADGELARTLLAWQQARSAAVAPDLARREENKTKLVELRSRAAKLSKLIAAGESHTVGLKTDGTVAAAGYKYGRQCDVGAWRDIVAVCAGYYHTVGLKSDGTVVAAGKNDAGKCDVGAWRLFQSVDSLEEEQAAARKRREQEAAERRAAEARAAAREAEEKARQIAQLQQQRADVQGELANLKGLFTIRQRRELEAELARIDRELEGLN